MHGSVYIKIMQAAICTAGLLFCSQHFTALCRYCRFYSILQVLSILLHLAGTVGSRCSSFELLRYPIFVFRDWFRRIGMKPHGGHGGVLHFRVAQLTFSSKIWNIFIFLK
jgi:hypothetical protein